MPQDTQKSEHQEPFLERILDRHHYKHANESKDDNKDQGSHENRLHDVLKTDERGSKEYLKEDEQLEQEGQTYGGLM
ncbi:hypothetical protein IFM53868_09637 [Aspergillus udagawae]|uniref:Uncharacterized protein n=1 Tax=Aspergillus udagawae TaxID=91492 RepID=A0ABQ1BBZ9_9EURO|nr:hypothetical protein IFM53868_09637 [Aspergillus udagawae]